MTSAEAILRYIAAEYGWFLNLVLLLILVALAKRIVGIEFLEFWSAAWKEVKDLAGRKLALSSVNLIGVLSVAIFGVIVVVALEFHHVLALLVTALGPEKTALLAKGADFSTLFFTLGLIFIVSVLAVVADARARRRRR